MLGIGVVSLAAGAGAIQWYIAREVSSTAVRAAEMYGEDRVLALLQAIDCTSCDLAWRNRAVWALGELEDARALPALRSHLTGRACDHTLDLCQYELDKAIRKTEGTWSTLRRIWRRRG